MQNKVRSLVEQMKYLALQSEKLLSRRIWTNITNSNPRLARLQVEKHRPHNLENHPRLQQFQVGLERYNEFFCWNLAINIFRRENRHCDRVRASHRPRLSEIVDRKLRT